VEGSNSYARTLIFGSSSFIVFLFVILCFSFLLPVFLLPPPLFFTFVSSLAYLNLRGTERLGCCCRVLAEDSRFAVLTESVRLKEFVSKDFYACFVGAIT
jgi:hypothetical protein